MYTLISGSPKPSNSNSLKFLKMISSHLKKYNLFELKKDNYEKIVEGIKESEIIVFSFPLYVDSPTSITLSFLDYIIDNKINLKNKKIYTIVNCGFREGEQNITAINIIKRWCHKVGANYGSSLMIGAGEVVGKEKFKFISKKAIKKIHQFANTIKLRQTKDDIITTMDLLNNKLYCYVANSSWKKTGKKNNLSNKELRIK